MAAVKSKKRRRQKPRTQPSSGVAVSSGSVLVSFQRCSAVPWRPSPVVAVAVCNDQSLVAVARENGSIELWNSIAWSCVLVRLTVHNLMLERASLQPALTDSVLQVMPGKEDASFTALCWAHDHVTSQWRLFSCGLDGYVVEWDLRRRQPLATSSTMGGAAWHMAAQPVQPPSTSADVGPEDPRVALATDDGAVRILAAEAGQPGLQYRSTAGRADARALCVAWRPDGAMVYAGFSDGCIRAMDVQSGTETLRITAGTNPGGEPACIWALACMPDSTLASTSSRGAVQFWETQFGTSLSTVQQHQADVNAVAVSPSGSSVFAAGVDPSVVLIQRETGAGGPGAPPRYVFSDRRRPHTHDVRTMAVLRPQSGGGGAQGACLLTGGNDAELLVHSVDEFTYHHPVRVTAAPCAPAIAFSGTGRFVAADLASLDVWQAARAEVHEQGQSVREEGEALQAAAPPRRLACIELGTTDRATCATISPCGNFVACSSPEQTSLFAIICSGGGGENGNAAAEPPAAEARVARLRVPGGLPAASALQFAAAAADGGAAEAAGGVKGLKSTTLLVAALDGRLLSLDVDVRRAGELAAAVEVPLPAAEDAGAVAVQQTAYTEALPAITHMAASACGKLLAVATPHAVHILRRPPGAPYGPAKPLALPHSPSTRPVTAMCFSPASDILALSTVDERLELYSTRTRTRHEWLHRIKGLSAKLDLLSGHVVSLAFRPCSAAAVGAADGEAGAALGSIMLCSRTRMCHVSLQALKAGTPVAGPSGGKSRRRTKKNGFTGEAPGLAVRVMGLRSVLLGAGWVCGSSFLSVQADREAAVARLPAPLMLKLYGK